MSVQERLENALTSLQLDHQGVLGCGRTDTGVHASEFYAHVDLEEESVAELSYSLNAILPKDIAVYDVRAVHDDAHARFDATSRTYVYKINHQKDPFLIDLSYLHRNPLDIKAMNEACEHLLGKKEFTSFARVHGQQKTDFCAVDLARWQSDGRNSVFTIRADRFLRNMVRAIVGTLIEVGLGKIDSAKFKAIIAAKDRSAAGSSAPACGLYLHRVEYPYIARDE